MNLQLQFVCINRISQKKKFHRLQIFLRMLRLSMMPFQFLHALKHWLVLITYFTSSCRSSPRRIFYYILFLIKGWPSWCGQIGSKKCTERILWRKCCLHWIEINASYMPRFVPRQHYLPSDTLFDTEADSQ